MVAAAGHGPDSTAGTVSVFVLDDHELLRQGLVAFLTDVGGFRVVGDSGSAQEAMRRLPALRPDVMLLDVNLPDGSGIEVCRHVRARDPRIRALMLTSFDDEQARMASMLAGASGFVLKEVHSDALCVAIRRVAAGETLPGPDVDAPGSPARQGFAPVGGRGPHASVTSSTTSSVTSPAADPRLESLTGQERRVLALLGEGLSNREIGGRLSISEKTVKNYVSGILGKLGFQRRSQAAVFIVGRH